MELRCESYHSSSSPKIVTGSVPEIGSNRGMRVRRFHSTYRHRRGGMVQGQNRIGRIWGRHPGRPPFRSSSLNVEHVLSSIKDLYFRCLEEMSGDISDTKFRGGRAQEFLNRRLEQQSEGNYGVVRGSGRGLVNWGSGRIGGGGGGGRGRGRGLLSRISGVLGVSGGYLPSKRTPPEQGPPSALVPSNMGNPFCISHVGENSPNMSSLSPVSRSREDIVTGGSSSPPRIVRTPSFSAPSPTPAPAPDPAPCALPTAPSVIARAESVPLFVAAQHTLQQPPSKPYSTPSFRPTTAPLQHKYQLRDRITAFKPATPLGSGGAGAGAGAGGSGTGTGGTGTGGTGTGGTGTGGTGTGTGTGGTGTGGTPTSQNTLNTQNSPLHSPLALPTSISQPGATTSSEEDQHNIVNNYFINNNIQMNSFVNTHNFFVDKKEGNAGTTAASNQSQGEKDTSTTIKMEDEDQTPITDTNIPNNLKDMKDHI